MLRSSTRITPSGVPSPVFPPARQAEAGDALGGIVCGLGVELGRAEGGPLEGERHAPVI
jgi:hypothetical protein